MRWPKLLPFLLFVFVLAVDPARGDGTEGDTSDIEIIQDPVLEQMRRLDAIAPFEDKAPLWNHIDPALQASVRQILKERGYEKAIRRNRLAVVLVDISDAKQPKVAAVNGDTMMYAASLPKIAVLLGAFEKIAQGEMEYDRSTKQSLHRMIQDSSNTAATQMMNEVGKAYIARVLMSPRYRLYDPKHNGGLWVGKDYAKAGLWRRDPLHNLSHGATAMQVARFYYLLRNGDLVTPHYSEQMKQIMKGSNLEHKFVRALRQLNPATLLFRKSGSWRTFHSDSALVEKRGYSYIAVVLSNSAEGNKWLGEIIVALDGIVESS